MPLTDKVLRFLVNRIPIKTLKSELRRLIFMKYNFYGNENKAIYSVSGENILWSMKGLKITFEGNNNLISIGENVKFFDTEINIYGDNNFIKIDNNTNFFNSKININGSNNNVSFSHNLIFESVIISMYYNNNLFCMETTPYKPKDAKFYIEEGSKVYIGKNCQLNNLYVVANCNYTKPHKLVIGNNVYIAKDTIIRTSDGHTLIDPVTKIPLNESKDVIIGDNVWITSRCIILKGAQIPDGSMVAAGSIVNKTFSETNIMLAGVPAKIIRRNILWDTRGYGKYMREFKGNINAET